MKPTEVSPNQEKLDENYKFQGLKSFFESYPTLKAISDFDSQNPWFKNENDCEEFKGTQTEPKQINRGPAPSSNLKQEAEKVFELHPKERKLLAYNANELFKIVLSSLFNNEKKDHLQSLLSIFYEFDLLEGMNPLRHDKINLEERKDGDQKSKEEEFDELGEAQIRSFISLLSNILKNVEEKSRKRHLFRIKEFAACFQIFMNNQAALEKSFYSFVESIVTNEINKPDTMVNLKLLGSGSFGRVYLGVERDWKDFLFVIKMIAKEDYKMNYLDVIFAELKPLSILVQHSDPSFLEVYQVVYNPDKGLKIFMEYGSGDLHAYKNYLKSLPNSSIEETYIIEILHQIYINYRKLQAIGIVHRDVKPGNIILSESGIFKLADFGLAKTNIERGKEYPTKHYVGTFEFMHPSLREKSGSTYDLFEGDVYSLGITMLCFLASEEYITEYYKLFEPKRTAKNVDGPLDQSIVVELIEKILLEIESRFIGGKYYFDKSKINGTLEGHNNSNEFVSLLREMIFKKPYHIDANRLEANRRKLRASQIKEKFAGDAIEMKKKILAGYFIEIEKPKTINNQLPNLKAVRGSKYLKKKGYLFTAASNLSSDVKIQINEEIFKADILFAKGQRIEPDESLEIRNDKLRIAKDYYLKNQKNSK